MKRILLSCLCVFGVVAGASASRDQQPPLTSDTQPPRERWLNLDEDPLNFRDNYLILHIDSNKQINVLKLYRNDPEENHATDLERQNNSVVQALIQSVTNFQIENPCYFSTTNYRTWTEYGIAINLTDPENRALLAYLENRFAPDERPWEQPDSPQLRRSVQRARIQVVQNQQAQTPQGGGCCNIQ